MKCPTCGANVLEAVNSGSVLTCADCEALRCDLEALQEALSGALGDECDPETKIEHGGKVYVLTRTCGACPEQYDVHLRGVQVGYLRLRWGEFTVDYPDVGGAEIYSAEPEGSGLFEDYEREHYLREAVEAIAARHAWATGQRSPGEELAKRRKAAERREDLGVLALGVGVALLAAGLLAFVAWWKFDFLAVLT